MDVLETSQSVEAATDLVAFGEQHLALREGTLARLPQCKEIFDIGWIAREALGDNVSWFAVNLLGYTSQQNPFSPQVERALHGIVAWMERTEEYLKGVDGIVGPAPGERELPSCSDGDIVFVIAYLLPDYREFVDAAFDVETWDGLFAIIGQSVSFRDRLWWELPRCQEALEIGMVMRQVAGDWLSMSFMDVSGAVMEDIPYLHEVKRDLDKVNTLSGGLSNGSDVAGSSAVGGTIYYVTADPYVNIRSCASTSCDIVATAQNGEALTVIDDTKDWYEVRLDNGETAFIAGFLVSINKR